MKQAALSLFVSLACCRAPSPMLPGELSRFVLQLETAPRTPASLLPRERCSAAHPEWVCVDAFSLYRFLAPPGGYFVEARGVDSIVVQFVINESCALHTEQVFSFVPDGGEWLRAPRVEARSYSEGPRVRSYWRALASTKGMSVVVSCTSQQEMQRVVEVISTIRW